MITIQDIAPQAPTHILVSPVRHIAWLADTHDGDGDLLGQMCPRAVIIAYEARFSGYRLVINVGRRVVNR